MKTCSYCGRVNDESALDCRECGTNEFRTAAPLETPIQGWLPDSKPVPTTVTETESNLFKQFIPRGDSKLIFVLTVSCYGFMLSSLIGALVEALQMPPPPIGYFTEGSPSVTDHFEAIARTTS
jgi:hypothetical protein